MRHPLSIAGARVARIVDLDPFALPLSFLFPDADLGSLAQARDILAGRHIDYANARILLAVQSHLVRIGGRTILIDTCIGEDKQRPRRPDWHLRQHTGYLAELAAAGCSPGDIDIVLCTHLHADHVGWNTRLESGRWVPTFRNARYLASRRELDHWQAETARQPEVNHASFQDSVLPVIEHGLIDAVSPGEAIAENARLVPLPGHAPGQIGLELSAGEGARALFCGDAIHSPAQIFRPEWSSAFCFDREEAVRTRQALIARAVEENLALIPAHLRGNCMRIRMQGGIATPVVED